LASGLLGKTYILPEEIPSAPPGPPPGPKMHIAPKVLNTVAPPRPESHAPVAPPVPEKPAAELPAAPTPHVQANQVPVTAPADPTPSHVLPVTPPSGPAPKLNLGLDKSSPGKTLQDQMAESLHNGGGGMQYGSPGGSGGGYGGGHGGMQDRMKPGVSILTNTEGVDFDSYLRRLLATVKRNWYAVMPESAMLGDKGIVGITFRINHDGTIDSLNLERTSGKDPLDRAAMASLQASNPVEPLPPQFKGPFIELRFGFYYNLIPPDYGR